MLDYIRNEKEWLAITKRHVWGLLWTKFFQRSLSALTFCLAVETQNFF